MTADTVPEPPEEEPPPVECTAADCRCENRLVCLCECPCPDCDGRSCQTCPEPPPVTALTAERWAGPPERLPVKPAPLGVCTTDVCVCGTRPCTCPPCWEKCCADPVINENDFRWTTGSRTGRWDAEINQYDYLGEAYRHYERAGRINLHVHPVHGWPAPEGCPCRDFRSRRDWPLDDEGSQWWWPYPCWTTHTSTGK